MNAIRITTIFLMLILGSLASGCSSPALVEACMQEDWYERGYLDATDGLSTRQFLSHQNRCSRHGITPHRTDYLSGWVAGRGLEDPS
jgi:hypothetical protein